MKKQKIAVYDDITHLFVNQPLEKFIQDVYAYFLKVQQCEPYINFDISYYPYGSALTVSIDYYREETDEELTARIEQRKKEQNDKKEQKKKLLEKEKQLYLELKKKFGDTL